MVNYEDERFQKVESDKNEAMSNLSNTYDGMIEQSDSYYQAQMDASKEWGNKQQQLQQQQTDFAIEKIEQQKQQAEKDYKKEQSGAYADWKVESNRYGANAETMAQQGMINSGYAESSQVSMYNTYQNRVAQARESYNIAVLNYNNAIKDARLQNNSALAQIAYQALQTQLELSLQGFQYKNQLVLDKTSKLIEMENMYYNRYQDVLNQIYNEMALSQSASKSKGGSQGSGGGGAGDYAAIEKKPSTGEKTEDMEGLAKGVGTYLINTKKQETKPTADNSVKTGAYNVPYLRTAKDVEDYLKTYGVSAEGLLTEEQWKKKCEEGVAEYSQHKTYQNYLYDFVNFAFSGV